MIRACAARAAAPMRALSLSHAGATPAIQLCRAAAAPFSTAGSADEIAEASRRLFGNVATHDTQRSGRKLLRKKLKGEMFVAWYPPTLESYRYTPEVAADLKNAGLTYKDLYQSPEEERWDRKLANLKRMGKGPPKKGADSGKKKKKKR
jgi:hypothetical protein